MICVPPGTVLTLPDFLIHESPALFLMTLSATIVDAAWPVSLDWLTVQSALRVPVWTLPSVGSMVSVAPKLP